MLADVHCHLDQLTDPGQAVEEAKAKGVAKIISNADTPASLKANLALAKEFPEVECCLALHPANLLALTGAEEEAGFKLVEENLASCVGVGETGLDFKHALTGPERERQVKAFKRFIALARAHGLPVQVHSRQARQEVLDILEEEKAEKVLLHWFVGGKKLLAQALERGYFVSVGPSLLFQSGLTGFVKDLPLENLLLETDSPVPFQGEPARPAWASQVAAKVGEIKNLAFPALERQLAKNYANLFKR
jgi:TatD DNase family protein